MTDTRQRYWFYALSWLMLIYSTLFIVRPICDFLKASTPFSLIVNGGMGLLLAVITTSVWLKGSFKTPIKSLSLCILLITYSIFLISIEIPEEKIHFLQYGILAFFIFRGLNTCKTTLKSILLTLLLVSAAGAVDEGIQLLLPNRYFQWSDIALNCIAGGLGLAMTILYDHREIRKNRTSG